MRFWPGAARKSRLSGSAAAVSAGSKIEREATRKRDRDAPLL